MRNPGVIFWFSDQKSGDPRADLANGDLDSESCQLDSMIPRPQSRDPHVNLPQAFAKSWIVSRILSNERRVRSEIGRERGIGRAVAGFGDDWFCMRRVRAHVIMTEGDR